MKPTERFSNRVHNYVKFRRGYPLELIDLFRSRIKLRKSAVIADIGSGTGISSRLFLENGNRVFGIEPNDEMRKAAEAGLANFPNFLSVSGTSDNTGLPVQSVDFIVAAQAFHWFEKTKTRLEFSRILRENGYVVLIWNNRRLKSTEFLRVYETFLIEFGTDYREVRHENISDVILNEFFKNRFQKAVIPNSQIPDFEGLKGRV